MKQEKPGNKPHARGIMATVPGLCMFSITFLSVPCYGQANENRSGENLARLAVDFVIFQPLWYLTCLRRWSI